jgi:hypothetical protein
VGFQGITKNWEFAWFSRKKTVEQVTNLGGIDWEESKAGVQMFPTVIVSTLYRTQ